MDLKEWFIKIKKIINDKFVSDESSSKNEISNLEAKIEFYQYQYHKLVNELNMIKEKLNTSKKRLDVSEEKYNKINKELELIQDDIKTVSDKFQSQRMEHINKSKSKVLLRRKGIGGLIGALMTILSMYFSLGVTSLVILILGAGILSVVGANIASLFYTRDEPEIVHKIYEKYTESTEYKSNNEIISEKIRCEEKKMREWRAVEREYTEAKKNYNDLLKIEADKLQKIVNLRNKVLSLIFPNEIEEIKNSQFITVIPNIDTVDEYGKEETESFVKTIKPNNIV